jgi:hypothetical protein
MIDRAATMPVPAGEIVAMVTELEERPHLAAIERTAECPRPDRG